MNLKRAKKKVLKRKSKTLNESLQEVLKSLSEVEEHLDYEEDGICHVCIGTAKYWFNDGEDGSQVPCLACKQTGEAHQVEKLRTQRESMVRSRDLLIQKLARTDRQLGR